MVSSIIPNLGANITLNTLRNEAREAGDAGVKVVDETRNVGAAPTGLSSTDTRTKTDIGQANLARRSLDLAIAQLDTALAGGQQVLVALNDLRALAQKGADATVDGDARTNLSIDFAARLGDLTKLVEQLKSGDTSLFNTDGEGVAFSPSLDPSEQLFLAPRELSLGVQGSDITLTEDANVGTAKDALAALSAILDSLTSVTDTLSAFANDAKQLDAHSGFLGKLSEGLGVSGSLADLSVEAARLQALSVKQGLSGQSLGIANAAPETLLSLFRS